MPAAGGAAPFSPAADTKIGTIRLEKGEAVILAVCCCHLLRKGQKQRKQSLQHTAVKLFALLAGILYICTELIH